MRRPRTPRTRLGWRLDFDRAVRGGLGPEWARRANELVWRECDSERMWERWRDLRTPASAPPAWQRIVVAVLLGSVVLGAVTVAGWVLS